MNGTADLVLPSHKLLSSFFVTNSKNKHKNYLVHILFEDFMNTQSPWLCFIVDFMSTCEHFSR